MRYLIIVPADGATTAKDAPGKVNWPLSVLASSCAALASFVRPSSVSVRAFMDVSCQSAIMASRLRNPGGIGGSIIATLDGLGDGDKVVQPARIRRAQKKMRIGENTSCNQVVQMRKQIVSFRCDCRSSACVNLGFSHRPLVKGFRIPATITTSGCSFTLETNQLACLAKSRGLGDIPPRGEVGFESRRQSMMDCTEKRVARMLLQCPRQRAAWLKVRNSGNRRPAKHLWDNSRQRNVSVRNLGNSSFQKGIGN